MVKQDNYILKAKFNVFFLVFLHNRMTCPGALLCHSVTFLNFVPTTIESLRDSFFIFRPFILTNCSFILLSFCPFFLCASVPLPLCAYTQLTLQQGLP